MAEKIVLKTGHISSRSLNAAINELSRAVNELTSLDRYGAMANAMYTCNGSTNRIFTAAMIDEAGSLLVRTDQLLTQMNAYSKLLSSGPEALRETDASFKGTYTNAWQRTWSNVVDGASVMWGSTTGLWNSIFHKGGTKTGSRTPIYTGGSSKETTGSIEVETKRDSNPEPQNPYLSHKEYNGSKYQCLRINENGYPKQAPNQCWANSCAIAESIMKEENISGQRTDAEFDCSLMAGDIANGKPVLLHFLHDGNGGEHWIVAIGIKEGCSEPYAIEDFLFVDSYDGKICEWSKFPSMDCYKNARPCGMQRYV